MASIQPSNAKASPSSSFIIMRSPYCLAIKGLGEGRGGQTMSMTVQHLSLSLTRSMTHTSGRVDRDLPRWRLPLRSCADMFLPKQTEICGQTNKSYCLLFSKTLSLSPLLTEGKCTFAKSFLTLNLKSEKTEESFSRSWDKAPYSSEAAHPFFHSLSVDFCRWHCQVFSVHGQVQRFAEDCLSNF